jgi:hypothetical protein
LKLQEDIASIWGCGISLSGGGMGSIATPVGHPVSQIWGAGKNKSVGFREGTGEERDSTGESVGFALAVGYKMCSQISEVRDNYLNPKA